MSKFYIIAIIILAVLLNSRVLSSPKQEVLNIKIASNKIQFLQPAVPRIVAEEYANLIFQSCQHIEKNLAISLFFVESSYNHLAVSKTRDVGLGQINLIVWGNYFKTTKLELLNPIININYACKILQKVKKAHPNDEKYYGYYHNRKTLLRSKYILAIDKIISKLKNYENLFKN